MIAALPEPRFTYAEYLDWTGDERWELIEGEAFLVPSPGRRHQEIVVALLVQIAAFLESDDGQRTGCRVYVAPFDVRLPKNDEPDGEITTVVQPDLAVICDPAKLDRAGCRGAPDWVIEVLSPATAARDLSRKRDLYEEHGVREYWIVDPDARTLLAHHLDPAYAAAQAASPTQQSQPRTLPRLTLDWDRVFRD